MLNTCSAENKFFIVELCNDILIDTIVLANYEFFSSIFRQFKVSVSDRYPVKPDKWKELGTFEARNTRDVQAFLVENPLIWARYLRIEFLTHYGSEYYCPVSLLRVHGTTMMQDFQQEEELARGEIPEEVTITEGQDLPLPDLPEEPIATIQEDGNVTAQVKPTSNEFTTTAEEHVSPATPEENAVEPPIVPQISTIDQAFVKAENVFASSMSTNMPESTCATTLSETSMLTQSTVDVQVESRDSMQTEELSDSENVTSTITIQTQTTSTLTITTTMAASSHSPAKTNGADSSSSPHDQGVTVNVTEGAQPTDSTAGSSVSTPAVSSSPSPNSKISDVQSSSSVVASASNSTKGTAATAGIPPPPQPSTQESFFKSIHKRLQQLESNSTLSLQYIEEQSRILRDAFNKVEKRQLSDTNMFLSHLNSTVMVELRIFRQQYDQLWQSTVIELESHREKYQAEMRALSGRLTLVADELVWQKRMGIIQSTLLLLCLGLVLFAKQGNGYLEVPLMQQMMNKSQAAIRAGLESSPTSPSPENRSPVSLLRRKIWRSNTGDGGAEHFTDASDSRPRTREGLDYQVEPPTPIKGRHTPGLLGTRHSVVWPLQDTAHTHTCNRRPQPCSAAPWREVATKGAQGTQQSAEAKLRGRADEHQQLSSTKEISR